VSIIPILHLLFSNLNYITSISIDFVHDLE